MKMLRGALLGCGLAILACGLASAQVVPQPGPPQPVACAQNTTVPALTDGQAGWVQCDVGGSVLVNTSGYLYAHIAAGQATTLVKTGAGTLHAIVFGGAATATNVTTVFDSLLGSGTVISIPAATAAVGPTTVIYDVKFATGLTILTGTANGSDMTVVYR